MSTPGWGTTAGAITAAVGAGASFAVATVIQARAARRASARPALGRAPLVARLARDPWWVLGVSTSGISFGLQSLALSLAPIALVQPLIVTDLLFALPLSARLSGRRLGLREWAGAGLIAGGLAFFLLVAGPSAGVTDPGNGALLAVSGAALAVVALALAVAPEKLGSRRASALAVAAGVCFGLMSALTKTVTGLLATRGVAATEDWQSWLLAGVALLGLSLAQSAYASGSLAVSLPLIDILEPVVAVGIGVTAFGETLSASPASLAAELVAAAAAVAGVAVLDHSPLVRAANEEMLRVSEPAARPLTR